MQDPSTFPIQKDLATTTPGSPAATVLIMSAITCISVLVIAQKFTIKTEVQSNGVGIKINTQTKCDIVYNAARIILIKLREILFELIERMDDQYI